MSLIKSYQVISLLNYLRKVVEKVITGLLSEFCEIISKLHFEEMGPQKQQYAIDIIASLVHKVQKYWAKKKLAAALFMDVKGAFNYISRIKLVEKMTELGINRDIV